MADSAGSNSGSGTPFLALLVGGLVVVVAAIAYFMYGGHAAPAKAVDVNINAPKLPDAPKIPAPKLPSTGA